MNTGETKVKHLEQQLEEVRDRLKHESDVWMNEKADLLRRLADLRGTHMRYVRRTEDVLSSVIDVCNNLRCFFVVLLKWRHYIYILFFRFWKVPMDIRLVPRLMGAIISLGCNWWKNMHQIDT